jgi:hypothetical protein
MRIQWTSAIRVVLVGMLSTMGTATVPTLHSLVNPVRTSPVAKVSFTMSCWRVNPSYYSIAVSSMGTASYKSIHASDLRTGEPYTSEFSVSSHTSAQIFQYVQDLDFLRRLDTSEVTSTRGCAKTLTFADGPIQHEITYIHSKNHLITRLTILFEDISTTMEDGRRLAELRTEDPGVLASELKDMARRAKQRRLAGFQAILPVVQRIAADPEISEPSRRYARAILQEASCRASAAGQLCDEGGER